MEKAPLLVVAYLIIQMLQFQCSGQTESFCSIQWDVRLFSNYSSTSENEGIVQTCYNGTWYSVCDYGWDCADANVVCRQLGMGEAVAALYAYDTSNYFGTWNYIHPYAYDCSGSETSLDSCANGLAHHYWHTCDGPYDDEAGVRCTGPLGEVCSQEGDVRLIGGNDENEGILEYCSFGSWSPFCSLGDEEATVACKQLGYFYYTWASILSPGTFSSDTNYSRVTASCSSMAAEYYLSDCINSPTSSSSSSCGNTIPTCSQPVGIRCYDPGDCSDNAIRLADGVLEQEGRVEVCVDGVWGSICGTGWSAIDGYVLCKQAGFDDTEPTVYTNSEFGDGYGPIVYSNVQCVGWEKGIVECPKYQYLQFTCSRSSVSGVLCHDDCTNGDVRLTGGEYDWEGTVEVCFDRLWGTIADSGWDSNDAAVVCKQLGYPSTGETLSLGGSFYDKPNRTVHFTNIACSGIEETISECSKSSYSLEDGKAAISSVEVAGVQCLNYEPSTLQPCLTFPATDHLAPQCNESDLRLVGGNSSHEGRLEFCYQQQWSPFCHLHHIEASVACKQLGYTQYTWAAIITSGEFGSTQNYSLFDNITCSDTASEYSLGKCSVNVGTCLSTCTDSIGIRCFEYGTCTEGDSRIVDGLVAQEGRVEVCVSGVWGSVCSTGWDTNDANVVCRQIGFFQTKPIPYYDFGTGNGPVVYSNVECLGWENSLNECTRETYLSFDCPPFETAGVFCADYCFMGEIRLIGGENEAEGTVEICLDSLWGQIDESGWSQNDARVVCEQLGYETADARPAYGSFYGKSNKPIHASNVLCLGDEEELIECTLTLYSFNDGRLHLVDAQVAGVSCTRDKETPIQPSASLTLSSTVVCQPSCSTTATCAAETTVTKSTTVTKVISSMPTVTTTSTASVTIYSTLTSTDTTTAVSISTSTRTIYISHTGSTVPMMTTVTTTSKTSVTIYSTLTSTDTITAVSISTSTSTVYISRPGSALPMICSSSPKTTAENLANNDGSSSTLLITVVALTFIVITIVVVVGVIAMVLMFRRQSRQHVLYTSSTPDATDTAPTSPSRYCTSHESAYELEDEKLKEATEERRDAEHKDKDSLETPQDHSNDETGM